eukprot:CAMPEP_0118981338 /NCGR_PEP_ID=MMETSP1173-20130426/30355_1 /TAXON_ID=1034831 /ORGANISM="Rhizochromulina marina cf, Strain CCMP1243" /LENGTH=196 /DNA_ID=CAMNT_0006931743 /DNA_START=1 /DNA_END=588 /DNA_ORIENTATION=+
MNRVPRTWEAKAYPSMKPLSSWMEDLVERLSFISNWVDHGIPAVFWISGFYFPQGFLTATLQNYARRHQHPIDTISFGFEMLDQVNWRQVDQRPEDSSLIRGLYLEGARWDGDKHVLQDPLPKQLYSPMPLIQLQPEKDRLPTTQNVYRLPIYKILSRRGVLATTGHSTNFVMWMEVPADRTNITNNQGLADQEEW